MILILISGGSTSAYIGGSTSLSELFFIELAKLVRAVCLLFPGIISTEGMRFLCSFSSVGWNNLNKGR